MTDYLYDIKIAIFVFPVVAFLITIPFILINYHKYGSINFLKTILIYSFVLYLICAYFLVILPLPEKEFVNSLTTPRTQLIPFAFILDIIKNFSFNLSFIKTSYVYVPLFNILLTIPFGIYLRYYFKCSFKKTVLYTFLLSLFFELTQLSGLYGIYSRGYRLCDVDDLIQNTCGGFLGYFFGGIVMKFMPSIEKINDDALDNGKKVSGFKRFTSLTLDLFISTCTFLVVSIFWDNKYLLRIIIGLYFIVTPIILKGTLAQKWLNLKVVDKEGNFSIIKIYWRYLIFIIIYILIPFGSIYLISKFYNDNTIIGIILLCLTGIYLIIYMISFIKYFFTKKEMLYEKISKTKLISTIK